jgi:hypothetical protein
MSLRRERGRHRDCAPCRVGVSDGLQSRQGVPLWVDKVSGLIRVDHREERLCTAPGRTSLALFSTNAKVTAVE